jgi:hypothetical protein
MAQERLRKQVLWPSRWYPQTNPHTFSPILLGSLSTTMPSPCLPCLFLDQHELFKGHASYPVPVAYWVVQLCGRDNGKWQLIPSYVQDSGNYVTCWLASSSCFPYNRKFRQANCSAYCLLHAGLLLGLFFDTESGQDLFLLDVGHISTNDTSFYPRKQNSSVNMIRTF